MLGDEQGSTNVMMPVTVNPDGSLASATIANAEAVTRTSYTPYGELRGADNLATDRGWLGQVEDRVVGTGASSTGTGLTYLNARYYDPATSRFISPDPLMDPGDPKTLDPHRYADNNPVVFKDASGLRPTCASGGALDQDACFYGTTGVELNPYLPDPFEGGMNREYDRGMNGPKRPHKVGVSTGDALFIPKLAVNFLGGVLNAGISTANGAIWLGSTITSGPPPAIPSVPVWDGDSPERGRFYYWSSYTGSGVSAIFGPKVMKPRTASSATASEAANTGRAIVDEGKFNYLFGKVTSGAHNADRSVQNAQQLARIGVYDNTAGRSLLSSHFDDVVADSNNIVRTFTHKNYGTFQVRESLFAGPGGFLKFESTWQVTDDGLRLSTVIPMGGS
ncbi:RHS repeat-associated core domain-containing protein [Demequina sp.]|uniref:RHS repeat-associated core domain-containing protein n=1 Tax=Demequina sp. TaxID=2050685 RepID=UPI0025C6F588|nr:RHS repeat-associated core domain-containing protein [Demequina sp.]